MPLDLSHTGFAPLHPRARPRLTIAIDALDKCGKTHFGFTGPAPIGHINFDIGVEGVIQKFNGAEIYSSDYRIEGGGDPDDVTRKARDLWVRFMADYVAGLDRFRTLVLDTATEVWELLRLARFGKLTQIPSHYYGPVNAEYRRLIRLAYDSDCNLVLLHKRRAVWEKTPDGKRSPTNALERAGMSETSSLVEVNAVIEKDPDDYSLSMTITNCRQNRQLDGEEIPEALISFPSIAQLVMPHTTPRDWD